LLVDHDTTINDAAQGLCIDARRARGVAIHRAILDLRSRDPVRMRSRTIGIRRNGRVLGGCGPVKRRRLQHLARAGQNRASPSAGRCGNQGSGSSRGEPARRCFASIVSGSRSLTSRPAAAAYRAPTVARTAQPSSAIVRVDGRARSVTGRSPTTHDISQGESWLS